MEERIIKDINDLLTQLFQKMKEAGYEWDADKRELKKMEQTPIWTEEDENEYVHILKTLNSVAEEQETKGYNNLISSVNWFKSLKDRIQPKQEWSEEDKENLNYIIRVIERLYDKQEKTYLKESLDRKLNWLKSIRPQTQWKPSEEQMEALDIAIRNGIQLGTWEEEALKQLLKQLKELK